jgi:hypothetical protein
MQPAVMMQLEVIAGLVGIDDLLQFVVGLASIPCWEKHQQLWETE